MMMSEREPNWLIQQLDQAGERVAAWTEGKKRAMGLNPPKQNADQETEILVRHDSASSKADHATSENDPA